MLEIKIAENDSEIEACYDVMAELRPHIAARDFLNTVRRLQERCDYQLAYLADGDVKAVAGFRIAEWLASGKYWRSKILWRKKENARMDMAASSSTGSLCWQGEKNASS